MVNVETLPVGCYGHFLGAPLAVRFRGCIVGGFNPFEKYARQIGFIFPRDRGEH